jgi:RHS repeat-associated protein
VVSITSSLVAITDRRSSTRPTTTRSLQLLQNQTATGILSLGGELIAEYAANAAPASPQKEYGYRNGELLITAEAGSVGAGPQSVVWTNAVGVSVSGNTITKTASGGWGNAGAVSTQAIASGDGYVEFPAAQSSVDLPFGEELFGGPPSQPGVGGRTTTMGYTSSDNVRQKFTQYERDIETGLDYFGARYYGSTQGRFTGVDPSRKSISGRNPQSWNRYSYTYNNPLVLVDDNGKWPRGTHDSLYEKALPGLSRSELKQIQKGSASCNPPQKPDH